MRISRFSQKLSSCSCRLAQGTVHSGATFGFPIAILLLALAACASPALTPLSGAQAAPTPLATALPPSPTETATPTAEVQLPAQPEVSTTPLTGVEPTAAPADITRTPARSQDYPVVAIPTINPDNPLRFTFPTAAVFPTPLNWRPPLQGVPYSLGPYDHFWFARPIASDSVNYPLGSYRYGSTYFGQMSIHAGIDIDAPEGTPILAAGPGQVVWVGYGLFNFNPGDEKDPYGIAVAVLHDFGYNNQPLYTLYAHMRAENNLFVGQRVNTGDVLGWIGVTGNTTGPHLHFEVRVGKNNYFSTRNPELWMAPYSGWGILLGQVLDMHGHAVYGTPITIYSPNGKYVDSLTTYGYRVANPDDQWHEHFVDSDLPAGNYHIQAQITNTISNTLEIMSGDVTLIAGQPHFVIFQEGVGFIDFAAPGQTATPPYPSDTPTYTPTPTTMPTPTLTPTRRPTSTLTPTRTRWPTWTPTPSRTPRASPQPTPGASSTAQP